MKKWIIGLLFVGLVFGCSFQVLADKWGDHNDRHDGRRQLINRNHLQDDARYILHRSAVLVLDAQKAAERGHRYNGLAMAIGNQREARNLYYRGLYREAIYHALRARDLAIVIIRANRGIVRRDHIRDQREEEYFHNSPRGEELDKKVTVIGHIGPDEAVVRIKFELDID